MVCIVCRNLDSSLDFSDYFLQVCKPGALALKRKGTPRRFVHGHTSYKWMRHLPVMTKSEMIKVSVEDTRVKQM